MNARLPRRARVLARLARLSVGEVVWIGRAQWQLLRARRSLLVAPRGRLLKAVSRPGAGMPPTDDGAARAGRVALAVDRAAEYGLFRPTCLVRSIALDRLLEREGIEGAVVRIGARRRGGAAQMHAWIEIGGTVIGERLEHTNTFTPLHDFTAVRRA